MPRKPKPPPKPERRRRGDGSISVGADGTIRARLPARIDPKRAAREFPLGQMAQATAWLDAHLHPEAVSVQASAVTLGTWAGLWHATYVEPIAAPNTARHHLYLLRMLAPLYATPLPDLRVSQLQTIVGQLAARVSTATVQMAAGVWRRCLEAAVDDELIARNPAKRLVLPKAPPKTARRHITPREAAILREAILGERFEVAFALLLGTGIRIGECLGLHWSSVDFANHRIWIQHQWTGSAWRNLPKNRSPRWLRIPPMVEAALIRHRDKQPTGSVLVMQSPFTKKGRPPQPWSVFAVRADLQAMVKRIGLEPLTPHASRHGLATALLNARVPVADVAAILGHSTPAITYTSYSHVSGDDEAVSRAVDDYLGGGTGAGSTRPSESERDSAS